MQAWVDITVPEFYLQGMERTVNKAIEAGATIRLDNSYVRIHRKALDSLIDNGYAQLDNVISSADMFTRQVLDEATKGAILEEVAKKRITGESEDKLSAKVEKLIKDRGINRVTTRSGRSYGAKQYGEMLSRTLLTNAQVDGTINQMAMDGHDLIIVSDHFGESDLCRPWENEILSVNGMYPQYTRLDTAKGAGLFRPNCLLGWNKVLTSEGALQISKVRDGTTVFDMFGVPTEVITNVVSDYSGIIYTISSGNFKMSGTPNHSTLTEFGWTFFEDIRFCDYLIQNSPEKRQVVIDGVVIDSKDFISKFQEQLIFHGISPLLSAVSVFTPINFYNQNANTEVGDISGYRFLEFKGNVVSSQNINDNRFSLAGISFEFLRETLCLLLKDFRPELVSLIVDKVLSCLASRDLQVFHNIFDRSWGLKPTHNSNLFGCFAFFVVDPSQKFFDISKLIFDLLFGSYIHINNIEIEYMDTKVYDIQTNGTYQLSNSIISHNCRHVADPYYEEFAKESKVWDASQQKYVPWSEAEPQNYQRAVNMSAKDKTKAFQEFTTKIGLADYHQVNNALQTGDKQKLTYYANKQTGKLKESILRLKKHL